MALLMLLSVVLTYLKDATRAVLRPEMVRIARWLHRVSASALQQPKPSVTTSVPRASERLAPRATSCLRKPRTRSLLRLARAALGASRDRGHERGLARRTAAPLAAEISVVHLHPPRQRRVRLAPCHHRHVEHAEVVGGAHVVGAERPLVEWGTAVEVAGPTGCGVCRGGRWPRG